MMHQKLDKDSCLEAMRLLDAGLDDSDYKGSIDVRAVGGFAMIWYGLRANGITADIDTISPTYPASVLRVISRVAQSMNLEPDWLNNDAVFTLDDEVGEEDVAFFDEMLDARYVPVGIPFKHISLSVADLDTLAKSKAYAVEDIGMGRSNKDFEDLVRIFAHKGICSLPAALKAYPWLNGPEFEGCVSRLQLHFADKEQDPSLALQPNRTIQPPIARLHIDAADRGPRGGR